MRLITADLVLAGHDLAPVEHGAVVVDGDRIAWVGRAADLSRDRYPAGTPVLALGPVTVLPGLIDCHVHLSFDGGPAPVARLRAEDDARQVALMTRNARRLLSVGVTTARDLGGRGYLGVSVRDAIADGTLQGPRLLVAGPPLTVTGGHCWYLGGEVDTEQDVRRMVRRHHKNGVDVVKIMSTGGFMTEGSAPWFAQFEPAEVQAAVEEAHRVGKRVAAHVHGVVGIERALDAGVDTLEHCTFVRADGSYRVVPELVDRIAASPAYVSPTWNLLLPLFQEWLPDRDYALEPLYRRGARVVASTDAGIDNVPHHGYVASLLAMAASGLPTAEVLTAATTRAAEALGLAAVTGALTAGLSADLIAVGGDPRHDLTALHDLRLVLARGEPFTPDRLPPIRALRRDDLPGFAFTEPAAGAPPPPPERH
jgi:imidazolonepropionase-like amidohydrolase